MGDSVAAVELLRLAIDSEKPWWWMRTRSIFLACIRPSRACWPDATVSVLTPQSLEAARLLGTSVNQVNQDQHRDHPRTRDEIQRPCGAQGLRYRDRFRRWPVGHEHQWKSRSRLGGERRYPHRPGRRPPRPTGWPTAAALACAVHLHGAAAERLATACGGPVGLTASELPDAARAVFNSWIADA